MGLFGAGLTTTTVGATYAYARMAVYTTAFTAASSALLLQPDGGSSRALLSPCAVLTSNGTRLDSARWETDEPKHRGKRADPRVLRPGQLRCFLFASDARLLAAGVDKGWTPVHLDAGSGSDALPLQRLAERGSHAALRAQLAPQTLPAIASYDYSAFVPLAAMRDAKVLSMPAVFESISRFLSDGTPVGIAPAAGTASMVLRRHTAAAAVAADRWLEAAVRPAALADGGVADDSGTLPRASRLLLASANGPGGAMPLAVAIMSTAGLFTATPSVWWRWWLCRLSHPPTKAYGELNARAMTDTGYGRCCKPGRRSFR